MNATFILVAQNMGKATRWLHTTGYDRLARAVTSLPRGEKMPHVVAGRLRDIFTSEYTSALAHRFSSTHAHTGGSDLHHLPDAQQHFIQGTRFAMNSYSFTYGSTISMLEGSPQDASIMRFLTPLTATPLTPHDIVRDAMLKSWNVAILTCTPQVVSSNLATLRLRDETQRDSFQAFVRDLMHAQLHPGTRHLHTLVWDHMEHDLGLFDQGGSPWDAHQSRMWQQRAQDFGWRLSTDMNRCGTWTIRLHGATRSTKSRTLSELPRPRV